MRCLFYFFCNAAGLPQSQFIYRPTGGDAIGTCDKWVQWILLSVINSLQFCDLIKRWYCGFYCRKQDNSSNTHSWTIKTINKRRGKFTAWRWRRSIWSVEPAVSTLECDVVLLCVCRHRSRTDVSKLQICNAEYDCFCARTTASFWVVADPIICTLRGASPLPVGR